MKKTEKYTFFWKDKIAQWNIQSFKDNDGIEYNCAEQYMMAQKALLFNDIEIHNLIMNEKSPKEQQKLGRIIKNFNQDIWNENAEQIVYNGNYFKFTQNKDLLEILLSTKDTQLVEASPFDKIWGVGLGEDNPLILDEKNWQGQNLLGKTLTKVRNDIKNNNCSLNFFLKRKEITFL